MSNGAAGAVITVDGKPVSIIGFTIAKHEPTDGAGQPGRVVQRNQRVDVLDLDQT